MNSLPPVRQQPLAPRSASSPSLARSYANRKGTPQFFQSTSIRKGKWTAQEEQYALFIIQEFENGMLRDCENGITLRAFLSRKLHCAPMRISKKYAGKSIGKLVYLSKAETTEECLTSVDTQLRDLESKFYNSLYEEMHPGSATRNHPYRYPLSMGGQPFMSSMMNQQGMMNAAMGTMPPHHHVVMPPCNNMTLQPPQMAVGPLHHQLPQSPQSMLMSPAGGFSMQQQQQMVSQTTPSSVHSKNLQQTYLNALEMMKFNGQQQQPSSPTNGVAVANPPHVPAAAAAAAPVPTPQVAAPSPPSAAPIPALSHSEAKLVSLKESSAATMLQQKPQSPPQINNAPSTEVPDFLSGFEKVSGSAEEQGVRPQWTVPPGAPLMGVFEGNGVPLQCSPPLTSKSFDDLHRLLGSDLSPKPFDLNASRNEQPPPVQQDQSTWTMSNSASAPAANAISPRDGVITTANYSADVYASFAQQSALAVSQHSAYCRVDKESSNGVHATAAPSSAPDISSNLAAMYEYTSGQTSFPSTKARMVSGSERSSDAEGGSMHGSTSFSNTGTSDTTSNDSDSASDDGPPRKKTKLREENAREVSSPVSLDRSSPRAQ